MKSWCSTTGRIVEQGDFNSLLANGGRFAELVQTQLAPSSQFMVAAE